MAVRDPPTIPGPRERGQATLLVLGVVGALLTGLLVLLALGQAVGAHGRSQSAADLAAMSAAAAMRGGYPRLFEPAFLESGVPNPRHLSVAAYLALTRAAARRVAARNGAAGRVAVSFPSGFAPTRVAVTVHGFATARVPGRRERARVPVQARAVAELAPASDATLAGAPRATGGGYSGPLAYRMGKGMRPDVAAAFDRMAAAAAGNRIYLSISSAFRSDSEQARLFAANPNPRWVAPPGTSLHRYATELDLGPPGAYAWLAANATRFGFIHRYAWEAWHYGFGANPRDRAHPAQYERGSWEPPGGDPGRVTHRLPSFVPPRFEDPLARAALRWNVPVDLLAAQLYAESGFNPFAQSGAGAEGIAQFMPGTARAYGLGDPYDPVAAIDAQAHLMSDLLGQFGGRAALALAAYNAGAGAVARYGGVPPYPETRSYVARILGLLGGAGDLPSAPSFELELVR